MDSEPRAARSRRTFSLVLASGCLEVGARAGCVDQNFSDEELGRSACLEALVLYEGRVQLSRTVLVIQVDSGVGQQITLPYCRVSP